MKKNQKNLFLFCALSVGALLAVSCHFAPLDSPLDGKTGLSLTLTVPAAGQASSVSRLIDPQSQTLEISLANDTQAKSWSFNLVKGTQNILITDPIHGEVNYTITAKDSDLLPLSEAGGVILLSPDRVNTVKAVLKKAARCVIFADSGAPAPDPSDPARGLSWQKAIPNLEDAIDRAKDLITNKGFTRLEIWTKKGDYSAGANPVIDRTALTADKKNLSLAIYGGFRGDEAWPTARDNSSHTFLKFVAGSMMTIKQWSNVTVDGLRFVDGNSSVAYRAAGISIIDSAQNIRIQNSSFINNTASGNNGSAAILIDNGTGDSGLGRPSDIYIENCFFSGNRLTGVDNSGSAIKIEDVLGQVKISGCLFSWNKVGKKGAVAFEPDTGSFTDYNVDTRLAITRSTFLDNTSLVPGNDGMDYYSFKNAPITGNLTARIAKSIFLAFSSSTYARLSITGNNRAVAHEISDCLISSGAPSNVNLTVNNIWTDASSFISHQSVVSETDSPADQIAAFYGNRWLRSQRYPGMGAFSH